MDQDYNENKNTAEWRVIRQTIKIQHQLSVIQIKRLETWIWSRNLSRGKWEN